MWLQHQFKRQLRLKKADSKRTVTLIVSWQNAVDWLRHAGGEEDVRLRCSAVIGPQNDLKRLAFILVISRRRSRRVKSFRRTPSTPTSSAVGVWAMAMAPPQMTGNKNVLIGPMRLGPAPISYGVAIGGQLF
jgi:hypothetical protein